MSPAERSCRMVSVPAWNTDTSTPMMMTHTAAITISSTRVNPRRRDCVVRIMMPSSRGSGVGSQGSVKGVLIVPTPDPRFLTPDSCDSVARQVRPGEHLGHAGKNNHGAGVRGALPVRPADRRLKLVGD